MTRVFVLFVGLLFVVGCAQITALEGGQKDTTAPAVDTLQSSPMGATNFHPRMIKLTFDEWIQLDNVFKNVLVSPPLAKRPSVTLKRKTVIFEFDKDEVLRENTTYSINFGKAIVDITEANAAKGLTYVFSTGPEIDSLSIQGKVLDAYTKKPVENASVMLYSELSDSIVYQEKPYYLAITDKLGNFRINNVRAGQFKAFALVDSDFDYKYSQVSEPFGFLNDLVTVSDSTPSLSFFVAPAQAPLKLQIVKNNANGIKLLEFNRPPINPSFQPIGTTDFTFLPKGDSIKIWYTGADTSSQLIILAEKQPIDTITLRPKSKLQNLKYRQLKPSKPLTSVAAHPTNPIQIDFNLPIKSWNDSLFFLSQDSAYRTGMPLLKPVIQIDSIKPNVLNLHFAWNEKATYFLSIFPKGITAFNDNMLTDTLTQKIKPTPKDKLGNILLTISPPDSTKQYVARLLLKGKEATKKILKPGEKLIQWNLLRPNDYTLELIEDNDKNGIWSPGNYLNGQQPERIFVKTLEKLRANWDLEVSWSPGTTSLPTPKTDKHLKK